MYGFLRIRIQCLQKGVIKYDQKEKIAKNPYLYKKNAEFYADFKCRL
jgi:hypothetical protein